MSKIKLADRIMCSDGDSIFKSEDILPLVASGKSTQGMFVDEITTDIAQFNKLVSPAEQVTMKKSITANDLSWNIPQEYMEMNVIDYIIDELHKLLDINEKTELNEMQKERINRVAEELVLFKEKGLLMMLRVLVYIINTLREKKIVWGVGRGSSVASYVLYVIGVHDIDSVTYDLDMYEFLH